MRVEEDRLPLGLDRRVAIDGGRRDPMRCPARGSSNRSIAAELGLTHGTVKVSVSALLARLGVADRTQAAPLAARPVVQEPSGHSAPTPRSVNPG